MMKKVIDKLSKKKVEKKTATSTSRKKSSKKVSAAELSRLIEKKAFELYVKRGYSHGDDQYDWYEAEKAVLSNLK